MEDNQEICDTVDPTKIFDLAKGVLYGPVTSRRLGRSLGVNILPFDRKICSFNCGYCQCGWTTIKDYDAFPYPTVTEIGEAVSAHLKQAVVDGDLYDCLTLAGNGEPTLHPEFTEAVQAIVKARDEYMSSAKVTILSNATRVTDPNIRVGLDLLDERNMKLDAVSSKKIQEVNLPIEPFVLEDVIAGMKQLKDTVIQSMFVHGRVDNTSDGEIDAWVEAIGDIKPKTVQIYSVDRVPADAKALPVPRQMLESISSRLKQRTGIPSEVYAP